MDIDKKALITESQEIIDGILSGSSIVLDRLYRLYFPMVVKLVAKNSGTEDDAKDVFQEALMVLYDKVQRKDLVLSSSFKTYLYAVCKNLWLKSLYKKDRQLYNLADIGDDLAIEEDVSIHAEADRQFVQMENALEQLGEPCRTIITDFYIRNQSMQDICAKFGYTNADNAKNQKYKCLQRLKKLFFGNIERQKDEE